MNRFFKIVIIFIVFTNYYTLKAQNQDFIIGDSLLKNNDYKEAIKNFEALVKKYPKDPLYNYYLGISYYKNNTNIDQAENKLYFASSKEDVPSEVYYYMAEIKRKKYDFSSALDYYKRFSINAEQEILAEYPVEQRVTECENGAYLLEYIHKIKTVKEQTVDFDKLTSTLQNLPDNVRIIPLLHELKTEIDIENDLKTFFNFPKQINPGDKLFFASYGEEKATGKDIYEIVRLEDGTWSRPSVLSSIINTKSDEDFPILSPDGSTLYFASKGHYSMGGYDIYKSIFNSASKTWSSPENIDFPINSPFDDFLFIPLKDEKHAVFASNRNTEYGKISIYTFELNDRPIQKTPANLQEIQEFAKLEVVKTVNIAKPAIESPKKEIKLVEPKYLPENSFKSEYDLLLDQALNLQLKADSIYRLIDDLRAGLTKLSKVDRTLSETKIVNLESQAYETQKQADNYYNKVREFEQNNFAELENKNQEEVKLVGNIYENASFTAFANTKKNVDELLEMIEGLNELYDLSDKVKESYDAIYSDQFNENVKKVYEKNASDLYSKGISLTTKINHKSKEIIETYLNQLNKADIQSKLCQTNIDKAKEELFNLKIIENNLDKTNQIEYFNSNLEIASITLNAIYLLELASAIHLNTELPANSYQNLYENYAFNYPLHVEIKIDPNTIQQTSEVIDSTFQTDSILSIVFVQDAEPEFEFRTENYYDKENPIPLNSDLPEKLIYRVQLGAFSAEKSPSLFKGMYPITADQREGSKIIVYYAGLFLSLEKANSFLPEIRKSGFKDAFVVPFWYGKRINQKRASALEQPVDKPIQNKTKVQENSQNKLFKVQITAMEAIDATLLQQVRKSSRNKDMTRAIKNTGEIIYSIGNFGTFEEAETVRNELISIGLKQVLISEVIINNQN